jgi:hypothetical protein
VGDFVLSRTLLGSSTIYDSPLAVAADPAGNWLVAGKKSVLFEQDNWQVVRLGASGNDIGGTTWNSPGTGADAARGVAAVPGGNYVVAGSEERADIVEGLNWRVRCYCTCGQLVWTRTYNGPNNGNDEANAVAADSSGNVIVAGYEDTGPAAQAYDAIIQKYGPAGETLWKRTYPTAGLVDEKFAVVATDSSGNIWAAGWKDGPLGLDWIVAKYGSDGTLLSSTDYDNGSGAGCAITPPPPPYPNDKANGIAVDVRGNVVVVGGEQIADCNAAGPWYWNWRIRIYDKDGGLLSSTDYAGSAGLDDIAASVAVDAYGSIYVAGYETDTAPNGGRNLLVRMYSRPGWPARPVPPKPTPPPPAVIPDKDFNGTWLMANAFRPALGEILEIKAKPVNVEHLMASVYTASGRFVRDLHPFQANAIGQQVTTWDGRDADGALVVRGVFLVRVRGGGVVGTLKVLVK